MSASKVTGVRAAAKSTPAKIVLEKKARSVGSVEANRGYRVLMIKSATFEEWRGVCRETGLTNDGLAKKLLSLVVVE